MLLTPYNCSKVCQDSYLVCNLLGSPGMDLFRVISMGETPINPSNFYSKLLKHNLLLTLPFL